jgi:hypothetical protein
MEQFTKKYFILKKFFFNFNETKLFFNFNETKLFKSDKKDILKSMKKNFLKVIKFPYNFFEFLFVF